MSTNRPDLWFSLIRMYRLITAEMEIRLSNAGLPAYACYEMLSGLENGSGGSQRMCELAKILAIERYKITRLVDHLEQEGLVTRARSAEEHRAVFVTITVKGRELRKKMGEVYEATVDELFLTHFNTDGRRVISEGFNRAAESSRISCRETTPARNAGLAPQLG